MLNRERRVRWQHRGGPLHRYLAGNVGRPWDMVYSELCQRLKRNSYNERMVRDQLERLVHLDVQEVNHQIIEGGTRSYGGVGRPLGAGQLYVCPRTGLLRRVRKRVTSTSPQPTDEPPVVKVDDAYQCHWREGVWYLLTMATLPSDPKLLSGNRQDVWLNTSVSTATAPELRKVYGGLKYAIHVRPLRRHELRNWPIPLEWL